MTNEIILKDFFLWLYNLNTDRIKIKDLKEKYQEDYKSIISLINPYFDVKGDFLLLKYPYFIGMINVNTKIASITNIYGDFEYIKLSNINNALNKDIVLVKTTKKDIFVELVIKHNLTNFTSEIEIINNEIYFIDSPFNQIIILEGSIPRALINGNVLYLKINSITNDYVYVSIDKILGHINDSNIQTIKLIYKHNWPYKDMDKLELEAKRIKIDDEYEMSYRTDLTKKLVVTIDGADAKDLDDAISLEILPDDTYNVSVHIADVSYFVKKNSNIDKEAYLKGTSVYLNDMVIPMLPKKLSNDLCSLLPNTNKYTITVSMNLTKEGKLLEYQIYPSVINSKYRLTYDEVNDFLINGKPLYNDELNEMIHILNDLSKELKKKRIKSGNIDFKSNELYFIKNNKGIITDVLNRETYLGEELIENFMILTNETVSYYLSNKKLPVIYRVHEEPDLFKLSYAIKDINKMGYNYHLNVKNSRETIRKILKNIRLKEHESIINMFILRSLKKARYDINLLGHYGLGIEYYSHFTAPIRRYADLLIHRILREHLNNEKINYPLLGKWAEHISEQEVKSLSLERDVIKLNSILYLKNNPNKIYKGKIISFNLSGMFVKLDNGIEGFVNYDTIKDQTFLNMKRLSLNIKNYKELLLSNEVNVKVLELNINELKIDFELIYQNKFKKKKVNKKRRR